MPRSTQNSQATPLVEVEADANRPSSCDVAGASSSNASPPGVANASAATNPPSQPSPEFLATVVQAVKAALAADEASVTCPASTALPNSGQSSSTASLSSPMSFGGFPRCYLWKPPLLLLLERALLHIPRLQELLLLFY